ncbi:MAG: hypothetical protein FWD22_05100, partial [Treponema sp.]|nr:hypothetical protein [Treponema sp.]
LDTFCQGIHALGIIGKNYIGAAKGDIKLTANGAMIGEIAARLSGGYMSGWTYPYSSGALPVKAAIQAAMGYELDCLIQTKKWTCAERAFISIPGTVKQIIGTNEAQETEHVNNFFLRIKEGDKVAFPENNVTKCGNILASAPDRETAIKAAETAARSVLIRLDPADTETGKFLEEPHTNFEPKVRKRLKEHGGEDQYFPPDAFVLTDKLLEAFAQLPDNNPVSSVPPCPCVNSSLHIHPFPEFEDSGLTDYMGRTVKEALEAVYKLTGLSNPPKNAENVVRLGKSFWAALIRGSYQGAVYYIDNLGEKIGQVK